MPTVTIDSTNYDAFADVATADSFLNAKAGSAGVWDSTPTPTVDEKGRALMTATRWIINWVRDKVTDANVPDPTSTPVNAVIEEATIELAYQLVVDSTIQDNATTGSNTKRVKAGSAEVEFFRPTDGKSFPEIVNRLLLAWLKDVGTVASVTVPVTSGTGTSASDFCDRDEFGVTTPLD